MIESDDNRVAIIAKQLNAIWLNGQTDWKWVDKNGRESAYNRDKTKWTASTWGPQAHSKPWNPRQSN